MAGRIQLRRGTAANWTSANPTLAQGEVGVETDTGRAKVGNGSTAWTSLPYVDTVGLSTKADAAATASALAAKADAAATTAALAGKVDASTLTTDGDLLTRSGGAMARTSRASLAGDTAFTSRFAPGARAVFTGDSITASDNDKSNTVWGNSWATYLVLNSNGRMQMIYNAAVGGYTSAQMLADFPTEVVAKSPTIVGILAGTNDNLTGGQPIDTAASTKSMVALSRAAGAFVFLCTLPPQGMAALSAPSAPTCTVVATGGTMTAATYRYVSTAVNGVGETTVSSVGSAVVASGTTNSVTVDVGHVEGATSYKVYKESTPGSGTYLLAGTINATSNRRFTDTGVTPSGAAPGSNTTAVAWNSTAHTKVATINNWIRRYAQLNAILIVDFHALLVDPTTGMYKTGWTTDGTHPTTTAQGRMGALAWSTLSNVVPRVAVPITHDQADPVNLYTNGCFGTGSGSLPTSWSSYGGSASGFTDTRGTKTGFAGSALTAARSIPDVRYHDSPTVSIGWSVGDRILVSFVLQTEGAETGGGAAEFKVRCNGSNVFVTQLKLMAVDVGPVIWAAEFTVPAGTTSFYLQGPYLSLNPITASLGQLTFYNLTTQAVLTP